MKKKKVEKEQDKKITKKVFRNLVFVCKIFNFYSNNHFQTGFIIIFLFSIVI